jgi:hypothetical protein
LRQTPLGNEGQVASRRGPKPENEAHHKVNAIVEKVGPEWRQKPDEVVGHLVRKKVPLPLSALKLEFKNLQEWEDFQAEHPKKFIKAIEHKLKWVKNNPA